ncbi:hypothetical protein NPS01_34150 [Nocardioides psychrotolerans]|uniref:PH domain-containing protein n=1 Tax=Nocardioides psychrotolerans TaxID=1005945 RepID=A0A1I3CF91_9ACTN|nr:hypothetical protein [Nocardioides psychrotolerans]GEP39752.1 hypothetical protein NPS01_34150 [Nocardioides psychrotolerans]SFH73115.1 hypothetical protein SAMN05216561_10233 [Nocardioides psychrotolerans]
MTEEQSERFTPTSGRVTGVIGLVLAVAVVVAGLVDRQAGFADWVIAASAAGGVLVWAALLRPRITLVGEHLELRNMTETVIIPLAAIEELAVRQLLVVRVGDKRFRSPALGKSRRQLTRAGTVGGGIGGTIGKLRSTPSDARTTVNYPDFVEERLRQRMDDARSLRGVRPGSAEQVALASEVRRQPAWAEIVALGACLLAVAVTAVL